MKGIIGSIVGNSIGQSYEQKKTRNYNFNLIYDRTHPADDSVAMLAVADWLMTTDHSDDALIDKFHYWCDKYNYGMWNYGLSTKFKDWIRLKKREPYNSYGNGAALRAPAVGWYAETIEDCLDLAKRSAEVTHNHPEGIKGAQAVACAIWAIRSGEHSKRDVINWIQKEFGYNLKRSYEQLWETHKFECTCQNSVPAAFICWKDSDSYEDCIRKAIALGGDADTEAGIAGALAAADPNTPVDDKLVHDLTRFFSTEFMELFEKFHAQYEK